MGVVAYNPIGACSIIYISASGLISLQSVCLAMLCLSEKPGPRHPSQARGGNRADQAVLSIRQAGLSRAGARELHVGARQCR